MDTYQENQDIKLTLWGPTQAGKDWLIRGFTKEKDIYHNLKDHQFRYTLRDLRPGMLDHQGDLVQAEPPIDIYPTSNVDSKVYTFSRERRQINNPLNRTPASPPIHRINIINDKGDHLTGALEDEYKYRDTYDRLLEANYLMLVLGIPAIASQARTKVYDEEPPPFTTYRSESSDTVWTRENYFRFINRLFDLITRNKTVAVCLTKIDQEPPIHSTPKDLLKFRFGQDLLNLIEFQKNYHDIKIFATTAAGYFRENYRSIPNFQGDSLIDPQRWHPFNTALPFFWIFDKIEFAQMREQSRWYRDYTSNFDHYPGHPWD